MSEFEQFAKRVEERSQRQASDLAAPASQRVTVLGGGTDGRLLAALSLSQNRDVTLFSAYGAELRAIREAGGITLRGDGPIGTYQIDQESTPSIKTTAELDFAVSSADLVFATGPVHKHRTYAMVLAEHLRDGQTLVVVPARTFAAFETRTLLRVGGCTADIAIVEVQTLPYWVQAAGSTLTLSAAAKTVAAAIPGSHVSHVEVLREIMPNAAPVSTVLQSSFSDAGGAVEAVALMFASSPVSSAKSQLPEGAHLLAENQTFRSLMESQRVTSVIDQALQERRQVAARFGVRNLPDAETWTGTFAGANSPSGGRYISDANEAAAMLRNAVSGSLIPLQSAGMLAGIATPVTDSLITLAGALLGSDIAISGRRLESLNISGENADDVRKQMESLARGN